MHAAVWMVGVVLSACHATDPDATTIADADANADTDADPLPILVPVLL